MSGKNEAFFLILGILENHFQFKYNSKKAKIILNPRKIVQDFQKFKENF
jgi:hypothetical protein